MCITRFCKLPLRGTYKESHGTVSQQSFDKLKREEMTAIYVLYMCEGQKVEQNLFPDMGV